MSELTGFDRRIVKRTLADMEPEKVGRSHLYPTAEALPRLYARDAGNVYDISQERARLLHHQANLASMDEAVKDGTLIPATVVEDKWISAVLNARSRLLSIPTQLAATCADMPRAEVEKKAKEIVYLALEELSESDSG